MATNNTTTSDAPAVFQLRSDQSGNWDMVIDKKVAPGPHIVTVQDDQGNEAQVMMYILDNGQVIQAPAQSFLESSGSKPQIVDRVINVIPSFLFYSLAIMAVMIIILIINALRLAKKPARRSAKSAKQGRWLNYLLLAIIAIILIITLAASFGYRADKSWNWGKQQQQNQIMEVSGRLVDPLTLSGAANVDLVSGNTSIRTNAGGQFLFSNVTADGIKATQANLLRAFALIPSDSGAKQAKTIYFNVNLYNTLTKVIDLEIRGKNFEVYNLLAPQIKEKTTTDKYHNSAKSIFTPANIDDQQINLLETSLLDNYEAKAYGLTFNKVLRLKVAANGATADYYFGFDGTDGWWLIK